MNDTSAKGRPQIAPKTGAGMAFAEFLNKNWDHLAQGRTIDRIAKDIGFKTSNVLSMIRTGKMKIPLEKIPDFSRVLNLDIAMLMGFWFEAYMGEKEDGNRVLQTLNERLVRGPELSFIRAVRTKGSIPDDLNDETIEAIAAVIAHPGARDAALKAAPQAA
ncbi:hypothetical protein [Asticcacaulis sp. AND118]|uniref:hypothetical protein n=1 Tax=Asticcacaulis sp. AND118 TaxID=2840468 RepID=UPI001D0019BA|nr:hypothetical protein [Asticcacaulis sp. AND118]UDF05077.1 hypothetical protein LH365_16940 [Asticcacaulis sp. AND118]